jgi:hypothetical protein
MSTWDEHRLPEDMDDVIRRLRDGKPEATALELDELKRRARRQASAPRLKGHPLKHRFVVGLVSLGLLAGGTGGVLAAASQNGVQNSNGAANASYYCPPASPAAGKQKNVPPPGNQCGQPGSP